ncbi:hypothetical protein FPV67DRAFT_1477641 [Lyophyllum atratum]|nr:hypothetical protein FPV67DRAFT_1477641 [Lyophyllum atratum]
MASSSAAKTSKKKGGGTASFKFLRNLIERPKSVNASASPSNSSRVSLSSVAGVHDPVPRHKVGTVEPTASGGNATSRQESGSRTQGSDRKATVKDGLGVASRFAQTLLKRVAECVDTNPVKVAFSIAKVIIEMKDAVGDNKDELVQRLEDTANRLLAVERAVAIGVPKGAEQEMEKLTQILQEEMNKLQDLARKSLAIQVLDHEEYQKMIRHIFQRVNGATASFQVHTLTFI